MAARTRTPAQLAAQLDRLREIAMALPEATEELTWEEVNFRVRNKIFHYGGLTKVNHYEFGRAFAEKFGYDPELIRARQLPKANKFMVDEVFDYSLNSTQLSELLKIKPLLLEQSFDLIQ